MILSEGDNHLQSSAPDQQRQTTLANMRYGYEALVQIVTVTNRNGDCN
jgi:hypothetical protein